MPCSRSRRHLIARGTNTKAVAYGHAPSRLRPGFFSPSSVSGPISRFVIVISMSNAVFYYLMLHIMVTIESLSMQAFL